MLAHSTIFYWHQPFTQGLASASPKPKSMRPVPASTETMMNMIGTMLEDDNSLLQRQIVTFFGILQTTVKKIILSLFFPAISLPVYTFAFMHVRMGVLFALLCWFFHRWCNKLWATCCFFYFFDSWQSRLVMGLVSLLKTQPL